MNALHAPTSTDRMVAELLDRLAQLSQDVIRDEMLRRRRVAVLRQLEQLQRQQQRGAHAA